MKCLRCTYDSKFKDRGDRICPACKREIAFEPQQGDPFTDVAFDAAIRRVSAEGRVKWGAEHLYYELCRMKARRRVSTGAGVALLILGGALGAGALAVAELGVLLGIGGMASGVFGFGLLLGAPRTVAIAHNDFGGWWTRWKTVHGVPAGLIQRKAQDVEAPRAMEADIPEYSFDRAVICDRARTVDLLLANDFHLENNCAVLSIEGYPARAFPMVLAMLKKNPRLVVLALHDATMPGCAMAHRLATDPAWFKGQGKVVDVGLSPAHAKKLKGLWLESTGDDQHPALSAGDRTWLSKWNVELAAVRPEQVIKRLFKAVAAYQEGGPVAGGDGGEVWVSDVAIFSSDAGVSDGGGDSFG